MDCRLPGSSIRGISQATVSVLTESFSLFYLALPKQFFLLCLFWASSVCKALQCLVSTLTQGDKGGHLFRLTCSVVLWEGRDTANKHHWHVWGMLTADGPHWVCHSRRQCVLPGSTLLRLQGALQGHCLKWTLWFVPFPGLSNFGDQVIGKCGFQVGRAS